MGDFSCGSMGTMDDYADGPVYGEKSKAGQYVVWGALAGITVWVLYCVIIAIVYGMYHWEHFGFAFLIVCTYVHMLLAFGLWKKSDQEEGRFVINFVVCIAIVAVTGLVLNFYVYSLGKDAPAPECPTCPPVTNTTSITCDTASGAVLNPDTGMCGCSNSTNSTAAPLLYRKLNLMSNSKLVHSDE